MQNFGIKLGIPVLGAVTALLALPLKSQEAETSKALLEHMADSNEQEVSEAYKWLDVVLEASARDVERVGARPTILSRQMQIPVNAMFDAWACYDDVAVGTIYGAELRRPEVERTEKNKNTAIAYAVYRTTIDVLPHHEDYITEQMKQAGYDPTNKSMDDTTAAGIGNKVAASLLEMRHHDGANQLGDEQGSDGNSYSDYTMYTPVNPAGGPVYDPNRWQPLPFTKADGEVHYPDFLTPHWYRVKSFALESADQFRPGPPPLVGNEQLEKEIAECVEVNANLTPKQKALVEFMRDGPRSTGQSGHWLRFAQDVSRRDKNNLDTDVKLFFAVANCAFDTFIASWDAKRYYDSSRPMTLIRHVYYKDQKIHSWCGPGKGVVEMKGEDWIPYSPANFITPPFPGYTSGHATVSGGCAEIIKLFTGTDEFGIMEHRTAGEITEEGFTCSEMQTRDGKPLMTSEHESCAVVLQLKTLTEAAEMAAESRMLGGYHIRADNEVGLKMGREVAHEVWKVTKAHIDGTADALPGKMSRNQ
jgi:hypothetical protein